MKIIAMLIMLAIMTISCSSNEKKAAGKLSLHQEIRFAISAVPDSFDPRKAQSLIEHNFASFLYEGLMRYNADGTIEPAAAEAYELSPDRKNYTFFLRNALWSNGDPISAKDFEVSWKSQLSKTFDASNSSVLLILERANDAYQGRDIVDNIGVFAVDEKTLLVTIEHPIPNFLELTTYSAFFPINHRLAQKSDVTTVFNGPFVIENSQKQDQITLKKNESYWDAAHITFKKAHFFHLNNSEAMSRFEMKELDWIGSPFSSISLDRSNDLSTIPADGTLFLLPDCRHPLLANKNLRRALCLAIDRKGICNQALKSTYEPATGLVPPIMGLPRSSFFAPYSLSEARSFLQLALQELHKTTKEIKLILSYQATDQNNTIAHCVQKIWKEALDIDVQLQASVHPIIHSDIRIDSWFARVNDPMIFLSPLKNDSWNNQQYNSFLDKAAVEVDISVRNALFDRAQAILMDEMPILPVFYYSYNYLINPHVQAVHVSPLGYLSLRNGYMTE